jgi:hypothetical protein
MTTLRQELIERLYDRCEFPHCARNVYSNVYYGMCDALNMNSEDFKFFFPTILSPLYDGYKLDQEKCYNLTNDIINNCQITLLQGIVDYIEYYANLEYPSDFDEGYDSP